MLRRHQPVRQIILQMPQIYRGDKWLLWGRFSYKLTCQAAIREGYLGSGMVKGIGPVYAGKLVQSFGAAVFDVIEQSPQRLREIPGIGDVRARKITAGWADQKVIRSIMVFLHAHGLLLGEGHVGLPILERSLKFAQSTSLLRPMPRWAI